MSSFLQRIINTKILGRFPVLQLSVQTVQRAGFAVFIHTVKRRIKHYSWRFNADPDAAETSSPLKTFEARDYTPASPPSLMGDGEAIRKKLEDLMACMENVNDALRCSGRGWRLACEHRSVVRQDAHVGPPSWLPDDGAARNRMLLLGKDFPLELAGSVKTSPFYLKKDLESLYRSLVQAVTKAAQCHPAQTVVRVLDDLKEVLQEVFGPRGAFNFFSQCEVALGLRKPRIAIYDHAFHLVGGGQRYAATLAEILQDRFDVTFIANKDAALDRYREWFGLDLSRCNLKIVRIPFFERAGGEHIDEGYVINQKNNPFDVIGRESLHYDIFINANMLTKVDPLSVLSIFICHFPDRDRERFFSVDRYTHILTNGDYGSFWLRRRWGLDPTLRLYPPVDMYHGAESADGKSRIILSAARFEACGSKKQLEMVRAFVRLCRMDRRVEQEWRFILAGGSEEDNPYLDLLKREIRVSRAANIEILSNLTKADMLRLYGDAAIFWHGCGLGEKDPHLVEHFGMTTVEAMQNFCVPIAINGGGQREIIEHGVSGFLFDTVEELLSLTLEIMGDDELRKRMARGAYERSHRFNAEAFRTDALSFFANLENRLRGGEPAAPCR